MNNEKLAVLRMLEEGKITVAEASNLLEAVGKTETAMKTKENHKYPNEPNGNKTKNDEPLFNRVTGFIAGKATQAAGAISREFCLEPTQDKAEGKQNEQQGNENLADATQKRRALKHEDMHKTGEEVTKTFELKVNAQNAELSVCGYNGAVMIKGYNGDKISAKVKYVPKHSRTETPEFITLGSKFILSYDENNFEKVSIDAFVPEVLFSSIKINCLNGAVNIASVTTTAIEVENTYGQAEIKNIMTEQIKCDTSNGSQHLLNIIAKNAAFECFNASVNASDIDAENLRISVLNGGLNFDVSRFAKYNDYEWELESNNDKLNLLLPSLPDVAYCVSAHAALSHVKIGLTGLNFTKNTKCGAEAKSHNYDLVRKKVKLKLETSNAPIVVN